MRAGSLKATRYHIYQNGNTCWNRRKMAAESKIQCGFIFYRGVGGGGLFLEKCKSNMKYSGDYGNNNCAITVIKMTLVNLNQLTYTHIYILHISLLWLHIYAFWSKTLRKNLIIKLTRNLYRQLNSRITWF